MAKLAQEAEVSIFNLFFFPLATTDLEHIDALL